MRIRKLLLTAALIATTVTAVPHVALAADPPIAAMKYEACMNEAEEDLLDCLDEAGDVVDALCMSRYGWAKLQCSASYAFSRLLGKK
jgi:hypothetical protein